MPSSSLDGIQDGLVLYSHNGFFTTVTCAGVVRSRRHSRRAGDDRVRKRGHESE